jgi:hypothetical protein
VIGMTEERKKNGCQEYMGKERNEDVRLIYS